MGGEAGGRAVRRSLSSWANEGRSVAAARWWGIWSLSAFAAIRVTLTGECDLPTAWPPWCQELQQVQRIPPRQS